MKPTERTAERERPYDTPFPPGQLRARMDDPDLLARIEAADFIMDLDSKDGLMRTILYYGQDRFRRIPGGNMRARGQMMCIPVDPATDDVEVLCAMVESVKGSHQHGADPSFPSHERCGDGRGIVLGICSRGS